MLLAFSPPKTERSQHVRDEVKGRKAGAPFIPISFPQSSGGSQETTHGTEGSSAGLSAGGGVGGEYSSWGGTGVRGKAQREQQRAGTAILSATGCKPLGVGKIPGQDPSAFYPQVVPDRPLASK